MLDLKSQLYSKAIYRIAGYPLLAAYAVHIAEPDKYPTLAVALHRLKDLNLVHAGISKDLFFCTY